MRLRRGIERAFAALTRAWRRVVAVAGPVIGLLARVLGPHGIGLRRYRHEPSRENAGAGNRDAGTYVPHRRFLPRCPGESASTASACRASRESCLQICAPVAVVHYCNLTGLGGDYVDDPLWGISAPSSSRQDVPVFIIAR